jgi:phenylalanyl-tRNA synthetase beta chain
VLTAAPHPQADKLQVLTVDTGERPLQVVCGAPTRGPGWSACFGSPGAVVPANGMVLKVAKIRGCRIERHDVLDARAGAGRRS